MKRQPLQELQKDEKTTVIRAPGGRTDPRYRRYRGRKRLVLQGLQGEEQTTVTGVTEV
jgi:hypothetical protein